MWLLRFLSVQIFVHRDLCESSNFPLTVCGLRLRMRRVGKFETESGSRKVARTRSFLSETNVDVRNREWKSNQNKRSSVQRFKCTRRKCRIPLLIEIKLCFGNLEKFTILASKCRPPRALHRIRLRSIPRWRNCRKWPTNCPRMYWDLRWYYPGFYNILYFISSPSWASWQFLLAGGFSSGCRPRCCLRSPRLSSRSRGRSSS